MGSLKPTICRPNSISERRCGGRRKSRRRDPEHASDCRASVITESEVGSHEPPSPIAGGTGGYGVGHGRILQSEVRS
ncbi:MAG: hypothetical protein QOJ51_4729 [Acidobacteriaceae bacterium]|jgi:hypothetical protein|nr:hypothetical protein [Acidobacteriaceae bacterium]